MLVCRHKAISQSVSQKIPLNKIFLKFRGHFLKAFRVDLKVFLGKRLPNQYCPIIVWESFQVILIHGSRLLLGHPYYEPLLWFMMGSEDKLLMRLFHCYGKTKSYQCNQSETECKLRHHAYGYAKDHKNNQEDDHHKNQLRGLINYSQQIFLSINL